MRSIVFLFALLIPLTAFGQAGVKRDVYGEAYWFRSDIVPTDGLIGSWVLDPGVGGDVLQNVGSFEGTWQGASGGCTNCPQSATCSCVPTSDITNEATKIQDYDTSLKIVTDATPHIPYFYYTVTLDSSTCYQASFWLKGDTGGTEDIYFRISNAAGTDYYNFSTDSWQVAAARVDYSNISATWTKYSAYIKTGLVTKTNYRMSFGGLGASQTAYIDGIKLEKLNSCTPQDRLGVNDPQVPVTSDPNFGDSKNMSYRPGTGPAYKTGATLNGTSDYLSIADTSYLETSNFPEKSFSIGCRANTTTVAGGTSVVFSKYNTVGNNRSYSMYRSAATVTTYISSDGAGLSSTSVSTGTAFVAGAITSLMATYKYITNGGSSLNVYGNYPGVAVASSAIAVGPIYDGTADNSFGYNATTGFFSGQILSCDMYKKDLSAIEANKWTNPYFPSNNYGQGFYVNTCTQAAAEANCSNEKCRAGTPSGCQAHGTGVMPIFDQYTELPLNNYFSLFAGDISNPTITNWAKTTTGSGAITMYSGDSYYGSYSVRLKGGSADSSMITSDCINTTTSYYIYASAFVKNLLERKLGRLRVRVYRYSDNACATPTTYVDSSAYYPEDGMAWQLAGFSSYELNSEAIKVAIIADGNGVGAYDYLVDMVGATQWANSGESIYWPVTPTTNATVTVNLKNYRLRTPLQDYNERTNKYNYEDGFCLGFWFYTDWPGNDGITHHITRTDATAAGGYYTVYKFSSNNLYFAIYDAAGNYKRRGLAVTNSNFSENGWKYLEGCSSNTGTVAARIYNAVSGSWYSLSTVADTGTGIMTGVGAYNTIGSDGTTGDVSNAWFYNYVIGPYSAVWPKYGFDSASDSMINGMSNSGVDAMPYAGGVAFAPRTIPLNRSGYIQDVIDAIGVAPSACWEFIPAVGATIATNCGGAVTLNVNGTPTRTYSNVYPLGIDEDLGYSWAFNGSTDYLSRADTGPGDLFDPTGSFSVVCSVSPSGTSVGLGAIIDKWNSTGGQRGWMIGQETTNLSFYISPDGNTSTNNVATAFSSGLPVYFTHTFTSAGAGTSISTFYIDNRATDTSNTMSNNSFDNTANFQIGARDNSATSAFPGKINFCMYFPGVILTEAQHDRGFAVYQGRKGWSNTDYVSVASTTPPALPIISPTVTEPFLVPQPANSAYIGPYGLYSPTAITNECWRSSFEGVTGSDPTGWTISDSAPALDISRSTTHMAHLTASLLGVSDGSGTMYAETGCGTLTKNTLYQASLWYLTEAGSGRITMYLIEDDSNDCLSPIWTTAFFTPDPSATWARKTSSTTTQNPAGTLYGKVRIEFEAVSQTTYVDAIQLHAGLAEDGFCSTDADSDAVCTNMSSTINNPITWLGPTSIVGTWRSPWNGVDLTTGYHLWANGSSATNNTSRLIINITVDEPNLYIRDTSGGIIENIPNILNWSSNTNYTVPSKWSNTGTMGLFWNGSWYTTTTGAGTGIISSSPATFGIASNPSGTPTGYSVWSRDLTFYRKLIY